jgi:exodeoxyribonuclease V alpha subunit
MVFLQGVGVSTSLAVRMYKAYRDEAIEVVRREPYRLAADVWGIGFKTADQIAQRLGIPHDSPQRVKAGLQFALSQATEDGHCYLPEPELVSKATELLEVENKLAGQCLEELVAEEGVVAEPLPAKVSPGLPEAPGRAIWLVPFHRAEVALAAGLLRLLDAPVDRLARFQTVDWTVALDWLHQRTGVTLAPEQELAVKLALTQRIAVLTGGPGCGKSYTVRAVVTLARAKGAKILLAAPTGRAAKRLGELAGLRRPPCTGCCSCAQAGMPPLTATIPWTPTWWWSTRPPCWMSCWPTSSSRPSHPAPISCSSATSTSSPASAPARSCGTCWPPTGYPESV